MKAIQTELPGVLIAELDVFGDRRGRFMETYRRERYAELGIAVGMDFVQDNFSSSTKNTLRGLHYQLHKPQGKLLHVTQGEVFDVVVDIRRGSPTFARWIGVRISAANHRQLWIPPGFAHGFLVLSETADIAYKCTEVHDRSDDRTISWEDPELAIGWPLEAPPVLSERDESAPRLRAAELPAYVA